MPRLITLWIALAGFVLSAEQSRAQGSELSVTVERLSASLAIGEHGTATLDALIGVDGAASDIRLVGSTKSEKLDNDALKIAAASKFTVQRDASGRPIAVRRTIEIHFDGAWPTTDNPPYLCNQLNIDQDWWAAHWPADKRDGYETKLSGFTILLGFSRKSLNPFNEVWPALKDRCRSQPDAKVLDIFRELIVNAPAKP